MDLHFIGVFCVAAQVFQRDQVIPDGDLPVVFAALYPVLIESFDPDGVHAEWNKAKQFETIGGGSPFLP